MSYLEDKDTWVQKHTCTAKHDQLRCEVNVGSAALAFCNVHRCHKSLPTRACSIHMRRQVHLHLYNYATAVCGPLWTLSRSSNGIAHQHGLVAAGVEAIDEGLSLCRLKLALGSYQPGLRLRSLQAHVLTEPLHRSPADVLTDVVVWERSACTGVLIMPYSPAWLDQCEPPVFMLQQAGWADSSSQVQYSSHNRLSWLAEHARPEGLQHQLLSIVTPAQLHPQDVLTRRKLRSREVACEDDMAMGASPTQVRNAEAVGAARKQPRRSCRFIGALRLRSSRNLEGQER